MKKISHTKHTPTLKGMLPCYNIISVHIWILILTFECYIGILGVYKTIARYGTNSHFLFVCIYVSADCRLGLTFTAACAPHCCVINHTYDIHWSLSHLFYGQQWQAFFIFTLCPLPQVPNTLIVKPQPCKTSRPHLHFTG